MVSLYPDSAFVRLNTAVLNAGDILVATMSVHIFSSGDSNYSVQLFLRKITNPITVLSGLTHAQARRALDALNQYKCGEMQLDQIADLFDELAKSPPQLPHAAPSFAVQAPIDQGPPIQAPVGLGEQSPAMRLLQAELGDVPSTPLVASTEPMTDIVADVMARLDPDMRAMVQSLREPLDTSPMDDEIARLRAKKDVDKRLKKLEKQSRK